MGAKKKILKVFIILILAVFLLSTALISVMYLGGTQNSNGTGDVLSGETASGDVVVQAGADLSGSMDLTGSIELSGSTE